MRERISMVRQRINVSSALRWRRNNARVDSPSSSAAKWSCISTARTGRAWYILIPEPWRPERVLARRAAKPGVKQSSQEQCGARPPFSATQLARSAQWSARKSVKQAHKSFMNVCQLDDKEGSDGSSWRTMRPLTSVVLFVASTSARID